MTITTIIYYTSIYHDKNKNKLILKQKQLWTNCGQRCFEKIHLSNFKERSVPIPLPHLATPRSLITTLVSFELQGFMYRDRD